MDYAAEGFMKHAMSDILLVASSALRDRSVSRRIALNFVEAAARAGGLMWQERDLTELPHIDGPLLGALRTDTGARTPEQVARVARADAVIEEVERARLIAITCPIYAHSIPSTLKAWIEHINRQGRVFRLGKEGPEGLLRGKSVCIVVTRGSEPTEHMRAFAEDYLHHVLSSFGMTDITFINAHNTAHEDGARQIAEAEQSALAFGKKLGAGAA